MHISTVGGESLDNVREILGKLVWPQFYNFCKIVEIF